MQSPPKPQWLNPPKPVPVPEEPDFSRECQEYIGKSRVMTSEQLHKEIALPHGLRGCCANFQYKVVGD